MLSLLCVINNIDHVIIIISPGVDTCMIKLFIKTEIAIYCRMGFNVIGANCEFLLFCMRCLCMHICARAGWDALLKHAFLVIYKLRI